MPGGIARDAVLEHMIRRRQEEGPKPTRDGTRLRGSQARQCSRKIAFEALGVETSIEVQDMTLVAFEVGNLWHETIQASLVEKFGAEVEVPCSYKPDFDLSGSADAVYTYGMAKVCVEIKSMKAYAWDMARIGNSRFGTRSGPKAEHLTQAGLYAMSPQIDADMLHMVYVNKDNGEMCEWLLGLDQDLTALGYEGETIETLVAVEKIRMQQILESLDAGMLPRRFIPEYGLVEDPPERGSKAHPWNCRFCGFQPLCVLQSPHEVPISIGKETS